jgi:hypothetical protein
VSGTQIWMGRKRISLPMGMVAAWYAGGERKVSRVKTLGIEVCALRVQCAASGHEPETGP